jgi:hypothetical protein
MSEKRHSLDSRKKQLKFKFKALRLFMKNRDESKAMTESKFSIKHRI